jgi:hypothetical protein
MKVCSAVVLAVARWWDQACAMLGCLGAEAGSTIDKLDARDSKTSTSKPLLNQAQLHSLALADADQPLLSSRSNASTASADSLEDSPSCDGSPATLSTIAGDDEALVIDVVVLPSAWNADVDSEAGTDAVINTDADPECEPDLELEFECGAKTIADNDSTTSNMTEAASPADVEAAAVALAQRLVPLTTVTGHLPDELDLSQDAVTTPSQWKHYSATKATFTAAAHDYVVTCAERDPDDADDKQDTTELIDAYAKLISSPLFDAEQRAIDRQWEDAQAHVNAAAFLLVHLAVEVPEREPLVQTVSPVPGQRPLTALEQRLDDAQVLTLFRKTPKELARASSLVFGQVDTDQLCLLELRALAHAASMPSTNGRKCKEQVMNALRAAKEQFDNRRRDHWRDVSNNSSSACFFHGPISEQVLPLYASVSPKLVNALTSYCDAEVATH